MANAYDSYSYLSDTRGPSDWDFEASGYTGQSGLSRARSAVPSALRAASSLGALIVPPAAERPKTTTGGLRGRAIGASKTGAWVGRDGHVESNVHFKKRSQGARLGASSSAGALPAVPPLMHPEWNRPSTSASALSMRQQLFTPSGTIRPASRAAQNAGRRRVLLGRDEEEEQRASSAALQLLLPPKTPGPGARGGPRSGPEKPPARRSGFDPRNAIQQMWDKEFAAMMAESEVEAQKIVDLRSRLLSQIIDEEGFHLEKVRGAFDGTEEAAVEFLEGAEEWLQRKEDEVWAAAGLDPEEPVFARERERVHSAALARRDEMEQRRALRGVRRLNEDPSAAAGAATGRRRSSFGLGLNGGGGARVRRGSVMMLERPEPPPHDAGEDALQLSRSSLLQDALERAGAPADGREDTAQGQRQWAVEKEMEPDDRALELMTAAAAAATRRALDELEELKERRRAGHPVTVRVCVSCTTRDTHGERQCLQEEVAPALDAWGAQYGIRFEFVDAATRAARTRAERAPEVNAMYDALDRVDACRPFFVGIVTQRWGEVPPRYTDQPGGPAAPHARWLDLWKPGFSFTALEQVYGAVRLGAQLASRQHAFVFLRHDGFLQRATRDQHDYFRDPPETRALDELRLDSLRRFLKQSPGVECYGYSCVMDDLWDNLGRGGWRVTGLSAFRESVIACIKRSVIAEFALQDLPKEHRMERAAQEAFMRERAAPFFGRGDALRAVAQFVHHWAHPHGPHQRPGDAALLLAGEAGIGKTATLARFLREACDSRTAFPGVRVAYVFVGASVQSWYARDVLNWLCEEMEEKPRRAVETKLLDDRRARPASPSFLAANPTFVPPLQEVRRPQYEELATRFRELVWRYDQQKLLIVLDGANQMVFGQDDSPTAWIPHWADVSGFVKIVVSSIDPAPFLGRLTEAPTKLARAPPAAPAPHGQHQHHHNEESNVVVLRPLLKAESEALLQADEVVASDKDAAAIGEGAAAKRDGGKPLYLRLLARELAATAAPVRTLPSHPSPFFFFSGWAGQGAGLGAAAAGLPGTVDGLLERVLARLESVHRRDVVRGTLCLVACARHGVAVRDLRELLALLNCPVPQEDLDELLAPGSAAGLSALLRRSPGREEDGGDHLAFIHREVKRAVRCRYLHACTAGGDKDPKARPGPKGPPGPGCLEYRAGDADCGHLAPWSGAVVLGPWEDKEGRVHRALARLYLSRAVSPARDRLWHTRRSAEWVELRRHLALGLSWDLVYRAENALAISGAAMDPHEVWSIVTSLHRRAPFLAGFPGYSHVPPGVPTPREALGSRAAAPVAGPGAPERERDSPPRARPSKSVGINSRLDLGPEARGGGGGGSAAAPPSSSLNLAGAGRAAGAPSKPRSTLGVGGGAAGRRAAADLRPAYADEPGLLRLASLQYPWIGADARALSGALAEDLPLALLDLSGNPALSREHLREIFSSLRENRTLRTLCVAGTRPGEAAVAELASALAENGTLTELDLSDCGLRGEAAAALARPLESRYCALRSLRLSRCAIADDGCAALAGVLPRAARLTALDVSANGITHRTAVALFKALGENATLKHLALAANPIGDEPLSYLAASLRQNGTLTGLVFGSQSAGHAGIGCTSEGASAIAEALEQNRALTSLDLDSNGVDDRGAAAFVRVLRWNRSIIHLDLTENRCGEEALAAVRDALRLNREYFWRRDAQRGAAGAVPSASLASVRRPSGASRPSSLLALGAPQASRPSSFAALGAPQA
eukprot:tig00001155_g7326.t1